MNDNYLIAFFGIVLTALLALLGWSMEHNYDALSDGQVEIQITVDDLRGTLMAHEIQDLKDNFYLSKKILGLHPHKQQLMDTDD